MMPGRPSTGSKTSGSLRRPSIVAPARGCSSRSSSTAAPFASLPGAGVISSVNRPAAIAASARRWLSSA